MSERKSKIKTKNISSKNFERKSTADREKKNLQQNILFDSLIKRDKNIFLKNTEKAIDFIYIL